MLGSPDTTNDRKNLGATLCQDDSQFDKNPSILALNNLLLVNQSNSMESGGKKVPE